MVSLTSREDPTIITNITSVSSDYTMTGSEQFIGVNTTSGEVVITLPSISSMPTGVIKEFDFGHAAGSNNVKIVCAGSDTFIYGNTYFNVGTSFFRFKIAILNNGSNKWGLVGEHTVKASAKYTSSWSSSNFSSVAVIPFEAENYNNQSELLIFTSGSSAKYTVLTSGTYKVDYSADIDSTGGSTWTATIQLYKNGSAVSDTVFRSGNYGNEDQSIVGLSGYIDLVAGDYIDVRIDQNSLTGNLVDSKFNVEIRL